MLSGSFVPSGAFQVFFPLTSVVPVIVLEIVQSFSF